MFQFESCTDTQSSSQHDQLSHTRDGSDEMVSDGSGNPWMVLAAAMVLGEVAKIYFTIMCEYLGLN